MSSESGSILKFEAALEDHHTSIRLMPEKSIEVLELKVVFPYVFEKKDSILMNGYQSWTVLKEYSLDTTNVMAEQVAKIMRHKKTDNCGDREFTNYEKENRWLHGVSYGYIRQKADFRFFGSLNEAKHGCGERNETVFQPMCGTFSVADSNLRQQPFRIPRPGTPGASSLDSRNTLVGCVNHDQIIGKSIACIWKQQRTNAPAES